MALVLALALAQTLALALALVKAPLGRQTTRSSFCRMTRLWCWTWLQTLSKEGALGGLWGNWQCTARAWPAPSLLDYGLSLLMASLALRRRNGSAPRPRAMGELRQQERRGPENERENSPP